MQILVAAGPGVVFDPPPYAAGGDYYTVPLENGSQIITVTIPAGMPSVSFDLQTWNDGVEDLPSLGYESITFTINSAVSRLVDRRAHRLVHRDRIHSIDYRALHVVGPLAVGGFFRVVQPLAFHALRRVNRREQPEIDVHRLEGAAALVSRLDMPARDVIDQRAMRC